MKALVVYDSIHGNTEKVARAIGEALGAETVKADAVRPEQLAGLDLLVVGAPTHGGRPSPNAAAFLKGLAGGSLSGVRVAAFDTRTPPEVLKSGFLRLLVRVLGWAGKRIAKSLTAAGGQLVAEPEGFIVLDREGPLKEGELERAVAWGRKLASVV